MQLQKIRSACGRVIIWVSYIGMALLFAMAIIVAIDVILRKTGLGRIDGSNELTTSFMVAVCILGIPVLQLKQGHVWVNLFVRKFPYRFRCFWLFAILLIETAVIGLLVDGAYEKIVMFAQRSTTTDILGIPRSILAIFCMVGFIEFFILSLIDMIQMLIDGIKNKPPEQKDDGWKEDDVKGL